MKCVLCPVKDGACHGETGALPHLCEWAKSPALASHVVDRCKLPPPGAPPKLPSLLTRAANFTRAVVSHAAAGLPKLDKDSIDARLAVCHGCDQRLTGGTCAGCGCNLKVKASWADQDCPLGKWPKPVAQAAPRLTVAVVIPCHDYGRYLADAVESALSQTRPPAEIVVVDDASDDDAKEVAARYSARGVRYLRVEHRDVHLTRRAGFEATTADVLFFLDADNAAPPDYLERGLPLFAERNVGIVYAGLQHFGDDEALFDPPEFEADALNVQTTSTHRRS